jgi:hypothetical protein
MIGDSAKQCLDWIVTTLAQLQPRLFPSPAPMVTTISHPGGVQIIWQEVQGATAYSLFENGSASAPPGVPIATIPANVGALSNSYLRSSITDTTTRYYIVVPLSSNQRGTPSVATPGTALAVGAATVTISQTPVNQGGVGGGVGGGGGIPGTGGRLSQ